MRVKNVILILVAGCVLGAGVGLLLVAQSTENEAAISDESITVAVVDSLDEDAREDTSLDSTTIESGLDHARIAAAVDEWMATLPVDSQASVTVFDQNTSEEIVSTTAEQSYFIASIYKLYLALYGYYAMDAGLVDPDAIARANQTIAECYDAMIRTSDSPCGEQLFYAELTGANVVNEYFTTHELLAATNLNGFTTTAYDAAESLLKFSQKNRLQATSLNTLEDSMITQPEIYRRGLPSGFSEDVVVRNKVGWNETKEWHDVAWVSFDETKELVLAVFTEYVSSSRVSDLATRIEAAVR